MFDFTQPVGIEVILGSIVIIFVIVGIGLGIVEYYKKRITKSEKMKSKGLKEIGKGLITLANLILVLFLDSM